MRPEIMRWTIFRLRERAWLTTSQERVIAHDSGDSNTHFPSALDVPPNHSSLHATAPPQ